MKTYCWKCEKHTEIKNAKEDKVNKNRVRGSCQDCGVNTSKTFKKRSSNCEE